MSAKVFFMKRVKDGKDVFILMNSEGGQVYSFCILQFSFFTKYNRKLQSIINKQNVNIADETFTDYSFLSRYHYTKQRIILKESNIRH